MAPSRRSDDVDALPRKQNGGAGTSSASSSSSSCSNRGRRSDGARRRGGGGRSLATSSFAATRAGDATVLTTPSNHPMSRFYHERNRSALPVAVTLRNFYVKESTKGKQQQQRRRHGPPMLLASTFELFAEQPSDDANGPTRPVPLSRQSSDDVSALSADDVVDDDVVEHPANGDAEGDAVAVLRSSRRPAALHPRWSGLTEVLETLRSDLDEDAGKQEWYNDPAYLSMRVRVRVSREDVSRFLDDDDDDDLAGAAETLEDDDAAREDDDADASITLATVPLHPTLLRRLPPTAAAAESSKPSSSSSVPDALPPNALLVHFSDGSLRVAPSLYELLLSKEIISEASFRKKESRELLEAAKLEEHRRRIRFSDDIFDSLDGPEKEPRAPPLTASGREDVFSLLDDDDDNARRRRNATRRDGDGVVAAEETTNSVFDDRVWNEVSKSPTPDDDLRPNGDAEVDETATRIDPRAAEDDDAPPPSNDDRPDSSSADQRRASEASRARLAALRRARAREESALRADERALRAGAAHLGATVARVGRVRRDAARARAEARDRCDEAARARFSVVARRARLVRQLAAVYPVRSTADGRHAVRGLELPADLPSLWRAPAPYDDAHVSTALGYACHLALMCAKYVRAPLRYRLVCNASRSAVQDNGQLYPLFKDKVEREQFETAVTLLDRNVDGLLATVLTNDDDNFYGGPPSTTTRRTTTTTTTEARREDGDDAPTNILEKLARILDRVSNGPDSTDRGRLANGGPKRRGEDVI